MGASVSTAESFPFCGSDATTLCYEKCRLEELDFSAYESAGSVFADTLESCPNLRDIDVQLFHFVTTQNVVFVRWLLLLGADPMACDANGTSVLHAACRCGSVTIVKDLIVFVGTKCASTSAATITRAPTSTSTAGVALGTKVKVQHAFVNRRDNLGWTPLHVACSVSRGSVIRELIRAGADAHVQTLRGETALDMALDGHTRKALMDQYMRDHFGDVGDVLGTASGVGVSSSSGQQKQFVVVNEGNHGYPAAVDEYPGEAVMKTSDASEDLYGQSSSIPVAVPDVGGSENIPTEGSADYPPSSAGTVSRAKKPVMTPRSGGQIRTNRSVAPAESTGGVSPGDDTERTMSMRSGRTNLNPPEVIDSAVRYEPFFVPRKPVLNANTAASLHSERGGATAAAATKRAQQLAELGIFFFNKSPGVGLAFLVATACCQDFPLALSIFLKRNSMHPSKTGEFLAESFSLSQVLRVEFLNSLRFAPCGVCGTLQRLLKQLHIPPDLKCIDRMLADTAMVWWRQCERKYRNNESFKNAPRREGAQEFEANLLFAKLKCYETLHMLLCNALLLHFHTHGKRATSTAGNVMGKTSGKPFVVSLQQWLALNTGIEDTYGDVDAIGGDVPRDVLTDVYRMVTAEPIQEITDGVVLTTNDQSVMQVLNAFATSTATADKRPSGGKILQPPPGNVFAATLSLHFCDGNFYPVPLGKLVRRLTGNRGHCTVFDHDEEFASQILHQEEGAAADPDDIFNYAQNPGGERIPRKFDINYATPASPSAGALFSASTAAQDLDLGTGTTRTVFSSAGDDQLSTRRSSVASSASGRKSSYANLGALLAENVTASSRGNSPVKNASSPHKQSSGRAPPPSAGALFPTPVKSIFDVDPSMPTASTQQKHQNEAIQAEQMTTGKNEVAHSLEDMLAGWAATESETQGDDPDEDLDEVVAAVAVAPGEAMSAWAKIPVLAPGARARYRSLASGGDGIVASVMMPAPGTTTQLSKANKMKVVRRSGDGFESHPGPTEVLATRTSPDGSYKYNDYGASSYSYIGAQQAAARGQDRQRIELSFAHSNEEEIVRVDSFSTKNASGDEAGEGSSSYLRHHAENMDCFAFLCCGLLFLSTDETAAPFAFVNLRYVNYNTGARVVAAISTDFGKTPEQEVPRKIMRTSASSASSSLTSSGSSSNITVFLENPSTKQRSENVELVLLFPDGRWESVDTPVLHLAFGDKLVRDAWMHRINTALADREPHA